MSRNRFLLGVGILCLLWPVPFIAAQPRPINPGDPPSQVVVLGGGPGDPPVAEGFDAGGEDALFSTIGEAGESVVSETEPNNCITFFGGSHSTQWLKPGDQLLGHIEPTDTSGRCACFYINGQCTGDYKEDLFGLQITQGGTYAITLAFDSGPDLDLFIVDSSIQVLNPSCGSGPCGITCANPETVQLYLAPGNYGIAVNLVTYNDPVYGPCPSTSPVGVSYTLTISGGGSSGCPSGYQPFKVEANGNSTAKQWLDTGVDISTGTTVSITASGTACLDGSSGCSGPDGISSMGTYNGCYYGKLVGKLGYSGSPFCVGASFGGTAAISGRLYLAYNDSDYSNNTGYYDVCVKASSSGQYCLTTGVSPQGSGSVSLTPTGPCYSVGSNFTAKANAASGYAFDYWMLGSQTIWVNPVDFTVTGPGSGTLTAYFKTGSSTYYTLSTSVNPSGSGTITQTPPGTSFSSGTSVKFEAKANSGFTFEKWTVNSGSGGTSNPLYVTMNENKSVVAYFKSQGPGVELTSPASNSVAGSAIVKAHVTVPSGAALSEMVYKIDDVEKYKGSQNDYEYRWDVSDIPAETQHKIAVTATVSGQSKTVEKTVYVQPLISGRLLVVDLADESRSWEIDKGCQGARVVIYKGGSLLSTLRVGADGIYSSKDVISGAKESALASGTYDVGAQFPYFDYNKSQDVNCGGAQPQYSARNSVRWARNREITQGTPKIVHVEYPLPLVLLHGIEADHTAWDGWATYLEDNGYLVFAPDHHDTVTHLDFWTKEDQAKTVTCLLAKNFMEHFSHAPDFYLICHSDGGVVARVFVQSGAFAKSVKRIYALGTPHSGTEYATALGRGVPGLWRLDPVSMRNEFNRRYRTFPGAPVFAIGGTKHDDKDDCIVRPQESVFRIISREYHLPWGDVDTVEQVFTPHEFSFYHACQYVPLFCFMSGEGCLTGADALDPILKNVILPDMARNNAEIGEPETAPEVTGPEAVPVVEDLLSLSPGQVKDIQVPVSPTDEADFGCGEGSGSASLSLVTPSGATVTPASVGSFPSVTYGQGGSGVGYVVKNPQPGAWTMRIAAQGSGGSVIVTAREDSLFRLAGGADKAAYQASSNGVLWARLKGESNGVSVASVVADVKSASGQILSTATLYDDGSHGDGGAGDGFFANGFSAPAAPGGYTVSVAAKGSIGSEDFQRQATGIFDVLSGSRILTGAFSSAAEDTDGDGVRDAIAVTCGLGLPGAGQYVLSGNLADGSGYPVASAAATVEAAGSGAAQARLVFDVSGASCAQFSSPFKVVDIELSDSKKGYQILDVWGAAVTTSPFSASLFPCGSNPAAAPRVTAVSPGAALPGQTVELTVSGGGFQNGATVRFGSFSSGFSTTYVSPEVLKVQWTIPTSAARGKVDVVVVNKDSKQGLLSQGFNVSSDQAPTVRVTYPSEGQTTRGTVTISAFAQDDRGISKVEFYVDGAYLGSDSTFPYQASWDATAAGETPHTLMARAVDATNLTGEHSIRVNTNSSPASISSVQKIASPFRLQINGSGFQSGLKIYIGGDYASWSNVTYTNSTVVTLGSGKTLKSRFPKGQSVEIKVVNPDGGTAKINYAR